MSPNNLVSFCLRQASSTGRLSEAGVCSAAAGNPVAARRLGSVRKVQPLRAAGNRLHFRGGRQKDAGVVQRRCFAYQLCCVDVYRY